MIWRDITSVEQLTEGTKQPMSCDTYLAGQLYKQGYKIKVKVKVKN